MEQVKKLEPKFKVGDTVYYYDYLLDVIDKDEIVKIEYANDIAYYYFKNTCTGFIYNEDELYKTFEECKNDLIEKKMKEIERIKNMKER